jgi:hypothetical protein
MLVFRLRMWFSSLGRTISPARREQERLRVEQEEHAALARFAAMFETRVEVPALAALPAPAAVEPIGHVRSLKRARVSSRKAKASPAEKTCPDCLETVLKTARSCVYCRYDFVLAESAWPLTGMAAANVA